MLLRAVDSAPTQATECKAAKADCKHQVKSQKLLDCVLDVVKRQNDKEGRGFLRLHGAETKITVLYKKPPTYPV